MRLEDQTLEDIASFCRSYLGSYKVAGRDERTIQALKKLNAILIEVFRETSPGDPPPLGISVAETINTADKGPGQI